MLAAAGIGAILSPPTLGAAAFIIAEYLGVPYLTVLVWAIVPTILYYLGILLAVEIDARRYGDTRGRGDRAVDMAAAGQVRLSPDLACDDRRFPRHGHVGGRAVVYATAVQIVLSFLDREHRLTPASGCTARWAPAFGACFPWLRYAPPRASSPR